MNTLLSVLAFLFISNPFISETDTIDSFTQPDPVEIVIEGNDQLQFNLKEIKVSEGDVVRLTLKHVGKLPKAAMGHNWVLLKQGTDITAFASQAVRARDNDYIPQETEAVIVNTEMIGGGQETTIEFEVPAPGEYDFICSFPGHYAAMQGKFIVE